MHLLRGHSAKLVSVVFLIGCGFKVNPPGQGGPAGGSGGSGGASAGTAGTTGSGGMAGSRAFSGAAGTSGGDVIVTGSAGSMAGGCGQMNLPIMPKPPDILIVQDKSLSMNDDSSDKSCTGGCGANSKWSQVSAAIIAVVNSPTGASVNWGLKFFGNDNMCGVTAGATVPIAPAAISAPAIQAAFAAQPSSYTPTETAVQSAVTYLQGLSDTNDKYLLLATDGLPNCPPGGGSAMTDDSTGAEMAVTNAFTAGFKTFVVGIATASNMAATMALDTMAMNGGEAQMGAATKYYSVTDTASLETALNNIIGIIASCTIPLTGAPTGFSNVAISADDPSGTTITISQDPTNGWSYEAGDAGTKNVILNGTACANLQNGTYTNFQFYYACAGTIIHPGRAAIGR